MTHQNKKFHNLSFSLFVFKWQKINFLLIVCMRNQFSSKHEDAKLLLHKGDFSRDWKGTFAYYDDGVNLQLQLVLNFVFIFLKCYHSNYASINNKCYRNHRQNISMQFISCLLGIIDSSYTKPMIRRRQSGFMGNRQTICLQFFEPREFTRRQHVLWGWQHTCHLYNFL